MSRSHRAALVLFTVLSALLPLANPALAAEPAPLRYRRIYVQQADLDAQIRGLLPLKRSEFDRRIAQAELRGQALGAITQARIEQAVYRARVEKDSLVGGTAELTISARNLDPAVLVLGHCNLPLERAIWNGTMSQPAQLGNLPDGRLGCVVPRSGTLSLDWSLAGRRDERGSLSFEIILPPVPVARLELDLPPGMSLAVEGGIASRPDSASSDRAANRWHIEAGGASRLVLHVVQSSQSAPAEPLVLVREANEYQVQASAIDLESTLKLDIFRQPIRQLTIAYDESLTLAQVRLGSQVLAWSPLSTLQSQRRAIVHFPEPLAGTDIAVSFSGVSNLNAETKQPLPRVRVEEALWQSGEATLTAPADLPLDVTPQTGCWQTGFFESAPARSVATWRFQQVQADAVIEVASVRTLPTLVERSGLVLEVQPTQVQATLTAELAATNQPKFEVEARIPRNWIVDAVEVQPADWLEDRTLQTQGTGPQLLRLRLRQPITPGRPLGVVVRAHRRRPADDQSLASDAWTLWRLADVGDSRRLIELRSSDPAVQLTLAGDTHLRRLDPASLAATDRKLFDTPPTGILLDDSSRADGVRVRLAPTLPRFAAQVAIRAEFDKEVLQQTCRLLVRPDDSLVAALTVRMSPPPQGAVEWSIVGEDARELVVERIVPPVPNPAEAVFDLRLQRPRRNPVEILARFSQPFVATHAIPLASLPGAASQTGIVEIHAPSDVPVAIEAAEMRAIPPLDRRATEIATLRGTYQFPPDRATELRVVSRPAERELPRLWIDSLSARSQIAIGGSGDHEFHLQVTNTGQRELIVVLDPAAAHLQVDVQGRRLLGNLARRKPNECVIPLPPAQRELAIRLAYTTPPVPSAWLPFADITVPWPQFAAPVLRSDWKLQLAPGLALRDSASGANSQITRLLDKGATTATDAWGTWHDLWTPGGPTATVPVYRTSTVSALTWGIALLVATAIVRVAAPGASWLAALAGLFAALWLLLPPVGASLAGGTVVGVALGAAIGIVRPYLSGRRSFRDRSSGSRATPSVLRPQTAVLLLLALAAVAVIARAAPPDGAAPEAAANPGEGRWRRVVIAVDDEQQPVGEYVFLEPEFYDELLRLTDRETAALPGWMLLSAAYRPMFAPSANDGLTLEALQATLELETFAGDQTVLLPLARGEVRLVEGRSLLDGKAAIIEWNADERLLVTIPQAGRHRLELTLTPASGGGKMSLIDMAIPAVNASRLTFSTSGEMPRVATDRGENLLPANAGTGEWQLGPIDRLRILPPLPKDAPINAASVEGEQLVLWTVRPGSVAAEGRFRLRPVGGQVTEATIEFDPQLRILPLAPGSPVARQWTTQTNGRNLLHLSLREAAAAEVSLAVSFAWSGASGIGDYSLPAIRLRSDKHARDWTAVSLADGLHWQSPPSRKASDPTAADFSTVWGEALPAGTFALDTVATEAASRGALALSIAPTPSQLHADEEVTCSYSLETAVVQYAASLEGVPAYGFQHRLTATGGLRISHVVVRDGERPLRAQWFQAARGAVHVQLAEPPPPAIQIEAKGELALPRSVGSHAAPLMQYQGAKTGNLLVSIARQPSVLLSVNAPPRSWEPVSDPKVGEWKGAAGRLVAVFRHLPGQPPANLQVTILPNAPEVAGLSLARLVPGMGDWELDLRCALDITGGQLDVVRWELPTDASGPPAISPAAEHEWTTLAGQATRRLLVRPQLAAADKLTMQVRTPLAAADAGGSIPLAGLLDWPKVRRLVALPQRDGERRLQWATSGLQAVDAAHPSLPADWLPAGSELFEVVADKPSVAAEVRTTAAPRPTLLLADHHVQLHAGGLLTGTSQLDLLPGGLRTATLAVPPGQRLLHVSVEGTPAQLVERGGGQWSFRAAGARVPQHIEIVFARSARTLGDRAILEVPELVEAKAVRSLWTVEGAAETSGQRAEQTPPAVVRLEALAAAAQALADPAARDIPPAALRQAFEAGEDRFRAAESQLPADLSAPLAARARAAADQLSTARQKLVDAGISLPAAAPPSRPSAPASPGVWQLVSEKNVPSVDLAVAASQNSPADWRLILAGAALGAGLAGWWLLASPLGRSWLARHGALVAAAAGFAWLAVGPAPWLGGLLVAIALWSSLRSPWVLENAAANAQSSISRTPVR